MNRKVKLLLANAIARLPGKGLRRLLYRSLMGYRIAGDAVIAPGVVIAVDSFSCGVGDRVMVAMGAVVTKVIPGSDVVVGGLPAKVLRERQDNDYEFRRNW